jgi:predicted enzyme related to lactoylglutathione lyase
MDADRRGHDAPPLALDLAYCITYVADLAAMTAFYRDTLGLPVAEQNARFVAFGGAGAPLALEAGGPPPDGPRSKERHPILCQFAVTAIDEAVAALAARGVPIEGAIKRGSFGALAFFRDPEGNRLALVEKSRKS